MPPSSTGEKSLRSRLFDWFIEPAPAITTEADRQTARVVSGLLLFLAVMLVFAIINEVPAGWLAFLFTTAGYGLSRTRYYQLGGVVAVIALTIPSMVSVLTAETEVISQVGGASQILGWLVIVLVLVSLWAKGWVTGVTTSVLVIMALSLLFIRPEVNTLDIGVLASLYGVSGGLLALGAGIRNRYVRQVEAQAVTLRDQQEQIQTNEQRYRELVENISDIVYRIDINGYFTYVSPAAAVITGYTGEELVGTHFTDLVEPSHRQRLTDFYIEQIKSRQLETIVDFPIITAQGQTRWVEQKTSLAFGENGKVNGFQSVVRDITDRRETEQIITRSQEQMRQVADGLNGAIYQFSASGDQWYMDYISDGVEKLAGVSAESAMTDIGNLISVFHPDDLPMFMESVNNVVARRGENFLFEGRIIHRQTDEIRWVRAESRLEVDIDDRAVFKGVLMDVTQRRQFEESLRLNTRAVESTPNGIVIADVQQPDMPLIYVNPAFEQMTGYSADEIIGQNCRFLQADDKDQPALNVLRSAIKNGKDCVVILRNYRKDGTMFWNELSINPIFDDRGVMTHFLGIQSDITERIQAETALKQRDEVLQAVAASSAELLQQGDWNQSVPQVLEMLGKGTGVSRAFIFKSRPESLESGLVVSMPFEWVTAGVQPDIDNPIMQHLPLAEIAPRWADLAMQKQVISGFKQNFAENEQMLLSDDVVFILIIPIFVDGTLWGAIGFDDCEGTHEWINVEIELLQSVADNIGAAIERQRRERILRQREAILSAVAYSSEQLLQYADWEDAIGVMLARLGQETDASRVYIYQKDIVDGRAIIRQRYGWTTPAFPDGFPPEQLQQFPMGDIFPAWVEAFEQRKLVYSFADDFPPDSMARAAINQQSIQSVLVMPIWVDGTWWGIVGFDECTGGRIWTQTEIDALQSAVNNLSATIERDIAQGQVQAQNESLVRANRELAVARRQAETASKLKSQFLATMSHELRTPLNAVIGYAQLQLAGMVGELTDEQYGFQERILANAQHLLMLINEVLDLSKIEAGRLELMQRPFNLRDCMEGIVGQNRILADDKGLAFDLNLDDRLPEIIIGDEGRIKQIIINLVSNAIKFTDAGSVTIDTVLYNKDSWRVTVTDTGIGIPPHLQETVFDEFRQAEKGIERGGTGLGLAIVRKLVLMMGGNIRLMSEVGAGSAFVVTLPLVTEIEPEADADEIVEA